MINHKLLEFVKQILNEQKSHGEHGDAEIITNAERLIAEATLAVSMEKKTP